MELKEESPARRTFVVPTKRITDQSKLTYFLQSSTCATFLKFLETLNESVKGKKNSVECTISKINANLLQLLDTLSEYIDQTPTVSNPGRFANPAYRTWFDKLIENAPALVKAVLPDEFADASLELTEYLGCSFGDRTRCDYGTGHETNFLVFLCCMDRLGLFEPEDYVALVVKVFMKYMAVMRKLQTVYILEPAGSKGVWAIDDFHFMVFYFGSSQLRGNQEILPSSIRQASVYNNYDGDYMYLAAIKWINTVKTGPFFEHSPTLDGIANVPHWEKVNQGMMKMYKGEVLSKFPVMQHFKFGSLLPFQ